METTGRPYKVFQVTHPDYNPRYWARNRALYSGDFSQPGVLEDVFPRRNAESDDDYLRRKRQAFYVNYPGSIVDKLAAGLFREQPAMEGATQPDPWYDEWFKDVSRPGGKVMPFNDLLKESIITALQTRRAWALVELPEASGEELQSVGDQERAGALSAYACPVDPECVRDWEMDENGALEWALLAFQREKRDGLEGTRDMVEEEYVYYTPTEYARYIIRHKKDKKPNDDELVPLVAAGAHSFGQVPLVPLELTSGMFAMGKLESLARAHLNLVNSLHWATIGSLFPTPTAFLGEEEMGAPATADPNRAVHQRRSPVHIVQLGAKDRFEFIGPSPEPFAQAGAQATALRDEMYRVVHQMADSIDNSGAALQRSGESKQADMASESVVLKWLGERLNAFACAVLRCVGAGRGDPECDWVMKGMEEFGFEDPQALLQEAQAISVLDIKSPTFHVEEGMKVVKSILGDDVTPEVLAKIRRELEQNNPPEAFSYREPPPFPPGLPGTENEEDTEKAEPSEDEPAQDDEEQREDRAA